MLRKPVPWLLRTVPALGQRARRARKELLDWFIRVRFRKVVFPVDQLAEGLRRAAEASRVVANLEALVAANLAAHERAAVEAEMGAAFRLLAAPRQRTARGRLFAAALQALARESLPQAIAFGEAWIALVEHGMAARALAGCHERAGAIRRPLELLTSIEQDRISPARARLTRQARLLGDGIAFSPAAAPVRSPDPRRILYYAAQTLPHHSSGYAIRTHWLVRHLRDKGWDVSVYTRHGYPNDRYDFIGVRTVAPSAQIDGVPYWFVPDRKKGMQALDIEEYQAACVETLVRQAEELRPSIIHCASNYAVGLAGTEAARRLGIPCIYEVRGLWHMTRASKQLEYHDSDHYELTERLEAQAAGNADRVFAITGAIKDILVRRGVAADKISILPNAVDTDAFAVRERDPELAARWKVNGRTVVGYVGTFKHYEGLDHLLHAAVQLRARVGDSFRLLLVGDGPAHGELTALARRLQLGDLVSFTGAQPHATIQDYYALLDVMAFPRKGFPVCEVVSPLKPFEAMAMAKAVVVSDVRALAEIVQHEVTGLVHRKDDVDSLCDQLEKLVTRPELRRELADNGCSWTRENRSWASITRDVEAVYRDLTPT